MSYTNLSYDPRENYFYPAGFLYELTQRVKKEAGRDDLENAPEWLLESIVEDLHIELQEVFDYSDREATKLLCKAGFKKFFPITGAEY